MCYTKQGFGTWVTTGQYTTHSFLFRFQQRNTIDKFLSLLPTLFNRRGNNSICCSWLEPGMRKLWIMRLPGIWTLKSSWYSRGRVQLALQWEWQIYKATTANQSRAAKTPCVSVFSGLKWFPLFWFQDGTKSGENSSLHLPLVSFHHFLLPQATTQVPST